MLEDLLTPDSLPGTIDYAAGKIRKVSAFSVEARSISPAEERDDFEPPGRIALQPVEMIAGDGWLISCWHPRSIYRGIHLEREEPSEGRDALIRAVESRWAADLGAVGHTAADLGILVMEELALTYAPTLRKLHEWLEQWEIGLYVGRRTERRPLAELWGSTALFRKWLAPLNPPGVQKDISKAWLLGATDHALCSSVDTRIDRALERGQELAATLRSSFNMLHSETEEGARRRQERGQHQIEILAAVFLVPTLIVGFFGANTWLPGRSGSVAAFEIMVAALAVLTLGVVGFLIMSRRVDRAMDREAEAELADMRAFLGYRGP
ncbi:hypothetical protein ASC61_01535 [Aeromicrobium sp. Root344]|nr:hypothetical protein ASC61_01535 [Aeromicrobium sp. Root344]